MGDSETPGKAGIRENRGGMSENFWRETGKKKSRESGFGGGIGEFGGGAGMGNAPGREERLQILGAKTAGMGAGKGLGNLCKAGKGFIGKKKRGFGAGNGFGVSREFLLFVPWGNFGWEMPKLRCQDKNWGFFGG